MKLIDLLEAKVQQRVEAGASNQEIVWADLQKRFGNRVALVSQAKKSSTKTDLKVALDGEEINIEVKGRQTSARWSVALSPRISPSRHNANLDAAMKIISKGHYKSIADFVQKMRARGDTHFGYAGHEGTADTGHIKIGSTEASIIKKITPIIRSEWSSKKDQYLATVLNGVVQYFQLDPNINVLPGASKQLPITAVQIETYGSGGFNKTDNREQTRVGLKFQL